MQKRDNRLRIPKDLMRSFGYYAEDEKLRVSDDIKPLITPEGLMIQTLINQATKMGHYPPKEETKKEQS